MFIPEVIEYSPFDKIKELKHRKSGILNGILDNINKVESQCNIFSRVFLTIISKCEEKEGKSD